MFGLLACIGSMFSGVFTGLGSAVVLILSGSASDDLHALYLLIVGVSLFFAGLIVGVYFRVTAVVITMSGNAFTDADAPMLSRLRQRARRKAYRPL